MTQTRPRLRFQALLAAVCAALPLVACAGLATPSHEVAQVDAAQEVARLLSGSFSSAPQAASDADYFDIRLHVVPIWRERADGPWLYVEQAAARTLESPYRQRVYQVAAEGGRVRSSVFELPGDPLAFAGAWRSERPLADVSPSDLVAMEGCDVVLERNADGVWSGGTVGESCATQWGGAAYATSIVALEAAGMTSWDRGWSADGVQVWGAVNGPYRFTRVE